MERAPICWFTSHMLTMTRMGQDKARNQIQGEREREVDQQGALLEVDQLHLGWHSQRTPHFRLRLNPLCHITDLVINRFSKLHRHCVWGAVQLTQFNFINVYCLCASNSASYMSWYGQGLSISRQRRPSLCVTEASSLGLHASAGCIATGCPEGLDDYRLSVGRPIKIFSGKLCMFNFILWIATLVEKQRLEAASDYLTIVQTR